ncbi:hypothetical protein ABT160_29695 [Streptomyces sp. NPDC001941]|uniref:TolB family protein n=1 Tax=Streptomyces sp. NPDC001941 TaxID=3154659 RepID=UPI003327B8B1
MTAAAVLCAATALLPQTASAAARDGGPGVERVSVASDGTQANGASTGGSITPDGHRVVLASSASNLTADTTTGGDRVFVRDQQTGSISRMGNYVPLETPTISGAGGYVAYPIQWTSDVRIRFYQVSNGATISAYCGLTNNRCSQLSLTADGRYVSHVTLFRDASRGQLVEVQDSYTGTRQTVATLAHTQPSRPSISGDGRYVAYQDGQAKDVFVRDRTSATTAGPIEGPGKDAAIVQLSEDGSKVAYVSGTDTYVHDVAAGTAQLVTGARGLALDPTGRYLLYAPQDTSAGPTLVLRDLTTGTDRTVTDRPATAGVDAVSGGGLDVVFQSAADDIVPGDTNGKTDVFVRHFS